MVESAGWDWTSVLFTAIGVFIIWASWGTGRLGVRYLNARLAQIGLAPNVLLLVEFILTMSIGVVVAITFVEPQTAQQAIAAGMGWTGLVTRPSSEGPEEST